MEHAAAHEGAGEKRRATLYVVATPIGNLGDISHRALEVLGRVDAVAAEDTRVTRQLLAHFGIAKRLIAVHEHNEKRVAKQVLALLAEGRSLALTCDAGTPAISDPGALLVAAARRAGFPVTPVPGPNAAIAALSASGLAAPHFLFYGFLPERTAARRRALAPLAKLPFTLVFFEAPHRVVESIADLRAALGGERRVVLARELTKLFETVHDCPLAEAEAWLAADPHRRKGEFVLIVEGAAGMPEAEDAGRRALEVLLAELPLKQAVALAAKIGGGGRKELYRMALELKRREP
ncbi:MAG: 16S rRNA (cytidine(1402)-2'-O)-methyltransferase [Betaproteobacteria bacterium RIFCSPLOWO2_02_FULL_67_26]|nr:MAG: 16S rRNA (cytidine(1402)-2'-O)-methyltransferase [Betaproteobacteria bacterium RIFCSPLOWO2_02_FULL_67_26]